MTIKWKEVMEPCREIDDITCDMCGETCYLQPNWEYARLTAEWGYGSSRDTDRWDFHFCDKCSGKILDFIREQHTNYST